MTFKNETCEDIWVLNDIVLRKARTRLKRLSVHTPQVSPAKWLQPPHAHVSVAASTADAADFAEDAEVALAAPADVEQVLPNRMNCGSKFIQYSQVARRKAAANWNV